MRLYKCFPFFLAVFCVAGQCDEPTGAAPTDQQSTDCRSVDNMEPLCGFRNPEDLAVLPGEQALIVSEYGDMSGRSSGRLSLLGIGGSTRSVLYSGGKTPLPDERWGDPDCEPPSAAFSPHGTDLVRRTDGRLLLLVVQHGGRESVEFFELTGQEANWNLTWRGCVPGPEDAQLNSVAGTPEGGFYTTKMQSLTDIDDLTGGLPRVASGAVYHWTPSGGYEEIDKSGGSLPNGIALDPQRGTLYVNYTGESVVKKIDAQTGAVLASVAIPFPDNIKWSPDRTRLLVASLAMNDEKTAGNIAQCGGTAITFCAIPFSIMELDPESFAATVRFHNPEAPMGGGTVGVEAGGQLFIGSFAGNRVLKVMP